MIEITLTSGVIFLITLFISKCFNVNRSRQYLTLGYIQLSSFLTFAVTTLIIIWS
jgi:hypothetical protein